jgi:hypothetical protein
MPAPCAAKRSFATLVRANVDRCYSLAFRILRDHHRAQDATQQDGATYPESSPADRAELQTIVDTLGRPTFST